MNYKETLFFVGKCLTINYEKHNLTAVKEQIIANEVDWDNVVRVSTQHYVFPALYCNLKQAQLLEYLPEDLVSYMKHITDLNRERNLQIIQQAKEINTLLTKNDIKPIFLKGTGFLLQDFYHDIAERMVGDIDFLVSKQDFNDTISILSKNNYSHVTKVKYDLQTRHYPRIQKDGKIAAVEIHHEITIGKYKKEFNHDYIIKNICMSNNDLKVMSYSDQLCLSIIAKQINDYGQYYKDMSLRNAYDVYILSQGVNSLQAIKSFNLLFKPLNNFLTICSTVLNTKIIKFESNTASEEYLKYFQTIINNNRLKKWHYKSLQTKLFLKLRIKIVLKSFTDRSYRYWLFKKVTDPDWYKTKMAKFGFKKNS